jgi:hypothetical protein
MAYYFATTNGNFNTMTWSPPGTPAIGDYVDANGQCVQITSNINLGLNGGFINSGPIGCFYTVGQTVSLTGNVFSNSSCCGVFTFCNNSNVNLYSCNYICVGTKDYSALSSICVINSNLTATGNFYSSYPYKNLGNQQYAQTLLAIDSTSNVLINGNIISNNSCCNLTQAIINNGNLCINGDINGGGVINNNKLTLNGCVIPTNNDVTNIQNRGTMSVYGPIYSSTSTNPAISSIGPCYVQKLIGGPSANLTLPIIGCFQLSPSLSNNSLLALNTTPISYNTTNSQPSINANLLPSITNYTNTNSVYTVQFSKPHGLYAGTNITNIPNTYSFCYTNVGGVWPTGCYCYGYYDRLSNGSTVERNNVVDDGSNCCSINTFTTTANVINAISPISAVLDADVFPLPSTNQIRNQHFDNSNFMSEAGMSNIANTSFITPLLSSWCVPGNVTPPQNIVGGFYRNDGGQQTPYNSCSQFPTSNNFPVISSVTTNSNYTNLSFVTPISSPSLSINSKYTYGIIALSGLNSNTSFNNYSNTYIISAISDPYTMVLYTSSVNNFVNSSGVAVVSGTNNQGNFNFNNDIFLFSDTAYNYNNVQVTVNNYLDPTGVMNGSAYTAKQINSNTLLIPVKNSSLSQGYSLGNVYSISGQQIYQDPTVSLATLLPGNSSVRSGIANGASTGTMIVPPVSSVRGGALYDSSSSQVGTYFFPSASSVRLNTVFDITSSGTAIIPPISSVLYNTPVDNTVGTATLNVSAIWNTSPTDYKTNTIGDLLINKTAKKADLFSLL